MDINYFISVYEILIKWLLIIGFYGLDTAW